MLGKLGYQSCRKLDRLKFNHLTVSVMVKKIDGNVIKYIDAQAGILQKC